MYVKFPGKRGFGRNGIRTPVKLSLKNRIVRYEWWKCITIFRSLMIHRVINGNFMLRISLMITIRWNCNTNCAMISDDGNMYIKLIVKAPQIIFLEIYIYISKIPFLSEIRSIESISLEHPLINKIFLVNRSETINLIDFIATNEIQIAGIHSTQIIIRVQS